MSNWSFDAVLTGTYVKAAYVRLAGDYVAGAVLSQLVYWFKPDGNGVPRARVVVDGELWFCKSYKGWHEDYGFSRHQMIRALHTLEAKGLVRTRIVQTAFGRVVGAQPIEAAVALGLGAETVPPPSASATMAVSEPDTPHVETVSPISTELLSSTGSQGSMATAREILKAIEGKSQDPSSVGAAWRTALFERSGRMQPQPTLAELAMFKRLRTVLGGMAVAKVTQVVLGWPEFAFKVGHDKGLKTTPDTPVLKFVLAHLDVLAGFTYHVPVHSSAQPAPVTKAVAPPPAEKPITLEEALALGLLRDDEY